MTKRNRTMENTAVENANVENETMNAEQEAKKARTKKIITGSVVATAVVGAAVLGLNLYSRLKKNKKSESESVENDIPNENNVPHREVDLSKGMEKVSHLNDTVHQILDAMHGNAEALNAILADKNRMDTVSDTTEEEPETDDNDDEDSDDEDDDDTDHDDEDDTGGDTEEKHNTDVNCGNKKETVWSKETVRIMDTLAHRLMERRTDIAIKPNRTRDKMYDPTAFCTPAGGYDAGTNRLDFVPDFAYNIHCFCDNRLYEDDNDGHDSNNTGFWISVRKCKPKANSDEVCEYLTVFGTLKRIDECSSSTIPICVFEYSITERKLLPLTSFPKSFDMSGGETSDYANHDEFVRNSLLLYNLLNDVLNGCIGCSFHSIDIPLVLLTDAADIPPKDAFASNILIELIRTLEMEQGTNLGVPMLYVSKILQPYRTYLTKSKTTLEMPGRVSWQRCSIKELNYFRGYGLGDMFHIQPIAMTVDKYLIEYSREYLVIDDRITFHMNSGDMHIATILIDPNANDDDGIQVRFKNNSTIHNKLVKTLIHTLKKAIRTAKK